MAAGRGEDPGTRCEILHESWSILSSSLHLTSGSGIQNGYWKDKKCCQRASFNMFYTKLSRGITFLWSVEFSNRFVPLTVSCPRKTQVLLSMGKNQLLEQTDGVTYNGQASQWYHPEGVEIILHVQYYYEFDLLPLEQTTGFKTDLTLH